MSCPIFSIVCRNIKHLTRPLFPVKMAIQFNSAGDRGCSPGEGKQSTGAVKGKSNGDSNSIKCAQR